MEEKKSTACIILALGLLTAACGNSDRNASSTESQSSTSESIMEVKPAEHEKAPGNSNAASPMQVIQSKAGPGGTKADLVKANVVGQILTVDVQYTPTVKLGDGDSFKTITVVIPVADVNYIDDNTAKKYTVLKDQDGKYMASPMNSTNKDRVMAVTDNHGSPVNVSFRFPAPPEDAKTVSISIPGAQPFDGVTVTR